MGGIGGSVRDVNRSRVLAAVRAGVDSRAALCTRTGLARSTVTGLVNALLEAGEIVEAGSGPVADTSSARAPGRPARRLRIAPRRDVVLAVDFGHSHCRVGVVELADHDADVLGERVTRLDVDATPDAAIEHAVHAARSLLSDLQTDAIAGGIGVPAPVDTGTGRVGTGNLLPRWVDRRPADELSARLGIPFAIDNDANLGALAEAAFGAARDGKDVVYVKASTGVGAGLLLGGRIHHGFAGRAGEIGHVPVDTAGALCRCGNRGCLETLASITQVISAVAPRDGVPVTMADVARDVDAGDPGVARVVGDAGRMIGRVLADLVNSLSPECIVLGGELATAAEPFVGGVREAIDRFAQPDLAAHVSIVPAALAPRAELLGAGLLAAGALLAV